MLVNRLANIAGRNTVFTSLDHARIVADGNRRGVRVLKEFLEYASRGSFTPGRQTGEEPDSDFERWFISRLKSANYEARPQVGVAKRCSNGRNAGVSRLLRRPRHCPLEWLPAETIMFRTPAGAAIGVRLLHCEKWCRRRHVAVRA